MKEIKPQDTTRATAYELWMKAPNPMVTVFKTMDVFVLHEPMSVQCKVCSDPGADG